ncbi:hypothetical protein GCM10022384_54070 [Streptomyces marokkonensis]|uniref:Uncharacterized protein n=1 Tax=Streptomyces marokkonensis TaxID=324855 RepID=A0ABP7RPD9_9ACTN
MKRFEARVRPWLRKGLRMAWQSLICVGAIHTGPAVYYYALPRPAPAGHTHDPFARYAPGQLQPAAGAPVGPAPGHPERVPANAPLSETERQLARELGPAHGQGCRPAP